MILGPMPIILLRRIDDQRSMQEKWDAATEAFHKEEATTDDPKEDERGRCFKMDRIGPWTLLYEKSKCTPPPVVPFPAGATFGYSSNGSPRTTTSGRLRGMEEACTSRAPR